MADTSSGSPDSPVSSGSDWLAVYDLGTRISGCALVALAVGVPGWVSLTPPVWQSADVGLASMASTTVRGLDVARVRGLYLSLPTGPASLDGPLSAMQPESVIRADHRDAALVARPSPAAPRSARSAPRRPCSRPGARSATSSVPGPSRWCSARRSAGCTCSSPSCSRATGSCRTRSCSTASTATSVLTPWLRAARARAASARSGPSSTSRPARCPPGSTST